MRHTAPSREITAQALGAAIVAFILGSIQWHNPDFPSPPPGFEAGAAVLAGFIVALVRKHLQRRKMTENELEADKTFCARGIHGVRDGDLHGHRERAD